jgi:hypothetical protein
MLRALFLVALLASGASTARAEWLPPLMVAYRDPQHGPLNLELAPIATSFVSWDGAAYEGSVGGGLRAAAALRGFWPDWRETSEWAVEARVRVLAAHVPVGGEDIEVPIDVLVRWGALTLHSYTDTTGWPTEVFEPRPWIPYVGIGLAIDVSTQHGLARVGPVVVGGIHWWVVPHFGLVTEIEVRAIFGDARPIGQLGGSLGLIVGL